MLAVWFVYATQSQRAIARSHAATLSRDEIARKNRATKPQVLHRSYSKPLNGDPRCCLGRTHPIHVLLVCILRVLVEMGPDLQNILRFVIRLSQVYRKIVLR